MLSVTVCVLVLWRYYIVLKRTQYIPLSSECTLPALMCACFLIKFGFEPKFFICGLVESLAHPSYWRCHFIFTNIINILFFNG